MHKTSDTALEQYLTCPRLYHEERHEGRRGKPSQMMLLGRVVHTTLEQLLKQHREAGEVGHLDIEAATELFDAAWSDESRLYDKDLYTAGLQQISDLIDDLGEVDPDRILGIEEWFRLTLDEDLELVGVMDLVIGGESFNDETGEVFYDVNVIDWKTSQAFLSSRDAEESLQMGIYHLAIRDIYPGADKYTAALHQLPDRKHLQCKRTSASLAEDTAFIKATARQIQQDESWEPRLNLNCRYCHLRGGCSEYQDALTGPLPRSVEDTADFDALAAEREALDLRKKAINKRLGDIDDLFKDYIKASGTALDLDDWYFKISSVEKKIFPVVETCSLLADHLRLNPTEVVGSICSITKKKVESLVKHQIENPQDRRLVQAAIANQAESSWSSRLYSKKKKKKNTD